MKADALKRSPSRRPILSLLTEFGRLIETSSDVGCVRRQRHRAENSDSPRNVATDESVSMRERVPVGKSILHGYSVRITDNRRSTTMRTFTLPACARPVLFMLALSLCLPAGAFGQWDWQFPSGQGNDLNDIERIGDVLWVVGSDGTVGRTRSGGIEWTFTYLEPQANLSAIDFVDADHGWIVGDNGTIYRTTNAGAEWTRIESPVASYINDVFFRTAQTGWITTDSCRLFGTTDGGNTWQLLDHPSFVDGDCAGSVSSLKFPEHPERSPALLVNARIGSNSVLGRGFFRSTDDGTSWRNLIEFEESPQSIHSIDIVSSDTMVAACANSSFSILPGSHEFWRTTDGGLSWELVNSEFYQPFVTDLFFLNASHGYATNEDGLFYTLDGGYTWEQIPEVRNLIMRSVEFLTPDVGWVVGRYGATFGTSDGGDTWQSFGSDWRGSPFTRPGNGISSIHFFDELNGIGTRRAPDGICVTSDGGQTWEPVWTENGGDVHGPPGVFERRTIMIPGEGVCMISSDSGMTWTKVELRDPRYEDAETRFWGIAVLSHSEAVAAASTGPEVNLPAIFKTTDGGHTWSAVFDGEGSGRMQDIDAVDDRTVVAVSHGFRVYRTQDGGNLWQEIDLGPARPNSSSVHAWDLEMLPSGRGWIVGDSGWVLKTTDGGLTWNRHDVGEVAQKGYLAVEFLDELNGWLSGYPDAPLRTTDGGATWLRTSSPTLLTADQICAVSPDVAFSVVWSGLLKFNANVSGVAEDPSTPRSYNFRDGGVRDHSFLESVDMAGSVVRLGLRTSGTYRMELYDMIGRLRYRDLARGYHAGETIEFDASRYGLVPGPYLLQVVGRSEAYSVKIVVRE